MFQYQGHCYENYDHALQAVCANAAIIGTDNSILTCSPGSSSIAFSRDLAGSTYAATLTPSFQECTVYTAMYMERVSQLWILPVSAFCILILRRVIR